MAKIHDRILELEILADESDDFVSVTAMTYYRHRGKLDASDGKSITHTAGSAAANHEVVLGEVFPPPTIIRLVSTFQS